MIEFRTVWVSLLAGTAVTVVAGLLPALRAARVTPIAAMREGVALERAKHSPRRRRIVLALVALYVLVRLALLASSGAGIATIVILAAIILAVRVPASRARIKAVVEPDGRRARASARPPVRPGAESPAALRATTRSATRAAPP